jgi:hypothetical protein
LEIQLPFGELAAAALLEGVRLDRGRLDGAATWRPAVVRWALPLGSAPGWPSSRRADREAPGSGAGSDVGASSAGCTGGQRSSGIRLLHFGTDQPGPVRWPQPGDLIEAQRAGILARGDPVLGARARVRRSQTGPVGAAPRARQLGEGLTQMSQAEGL